MTTDDLSLQRFAAIDESEDTARYVAALEAFDAIGQLQDLKRIERRRSGRVTGCAVLDIGCGFGLETLRLAKRAGPSGRTTGLDKSARFIAEARRRAAAAGLSIDFHVGDAQALPYPDRTFDRVRAERLLIYLENWERALEEMRRVVRHDGMISLIEPDMTTINVNLPDRAVVRRALAHEADTAVTMSWLPGPLLSSLRTLDLSEIAVDTRVLLFPPALAEEYFAGVGRRAQADGILDEEQLGAWLTGLARLRADGNLLGSIGYYLFTARAQSATTPPHPTPHSILS